MSDSLPECPTVIYIVARSGAEVNGAVCQNSGGYHWWEWLTQWGIGVIIDVGRPTADSGDGPPPAV